LDRARERILDLLILLGLTAVFLIRVAHARSSTG